MSPQGSKGAENSIFRAGKWWSPRPKPKATPDGEADPQKAAAAMVFARRLTRPLRVRSRGLAVSLRFAYRLHLPRITVLRTGPVLRYGCGSRWSPPQESRQF